MIYFTFVANLTFLPSFIFNSIASLNLKELLRIGSVQTLCFNFKRCPTLVQIGFIVVYFLSALWDLFIYICYTQAEVSPDFLVGLKKVPLQEKEIYVPLSTPNCRYEEILQKS